MPFVPSARRRWVVAAATLSALLLGTQAHAKKAPPAKKGNGITLLSAGTGTASPLRYSFKKGAATVWKVAIDSDMTLGGMPTMVLPKVLFEAAVTIASVDKSGAATTTFTLRSTKVAPAGKLTAKALEAINKRLKKLAGVTGEAKVDAQGRLLSYKRKPAGKKPDPQLEVLLMHFDQAFGQIAIPLPKEPIGKGGSWKVVRNVVSNAISLNQTAAYTLVKRGAKGKPHQIQVKVKQSAPRQSVKLPGLPATLKTKLIRADGTGSSTLTVAPDRMGTHGKTSTKLDLVIEMQQGKQSGKASVKLSSSMAFKRSAK